MSPELREAIVGRYEERMQFTQYIEDSNISRLEANMVGSSGFRVAKIGPFQGIPLKLHQQEGVV